MKMHRLLSVTGQKLAMMGLLVVMTSSAQANLIMESFGFGGQYWEFKHSAKITQFNKSPIGGGYNFVRFRNPETGKEMQAFIINDGKYFTICNPNMRVMMPLLRDMAQAYSEKDLSQQTILEAQVQKNLILKCSKSFTSVFEVKRLFNQAVGYEQMPGLAGL